MTRTEEKAALRATVRRLADALSPRYCAAADGAIAAHLIAMPELQAADTVFCFASKTGEIDTFPILRDVLERGKRLCVPLCLGKGVMEARQITSLPQLSVGAYGIPQPPTSAPTVPVDEIDFAVTKGLINGVAPKEYAPNDGLTRAMFVTLLYRLLSGKDLISDGIKCSFTDLEQDAWYEEPVLWAARNGVVNGYEDGSFRPDQRINREEMCVTLDRLLTLLNKNVEGDELTFSDTERISSWAAESVARLVKTGIIRGQENNRFAPASTATRAEAATVLHRLYDLTVGKRTSVTAA